MTRPLQVAIHGTRAVDVTLIDPTSILMEGLAPLRWAYMDVGTPYRPMLGKDSVYDCNLSGPDGVLDLVLAFSPRAAGVLTRKSSGDVFVPNLCGRLRDQTPTLGQDVVLILK